MPTLAVLDLLAQLPETTIYVHTVKLVAMVALFAIWAQFAQWVDKDTIVVNTYRVVWNLITRNTQAVKTGIYIWTVESRFGTDVGKLVIIK